MFAILRHLALCLALLLSAVPIAQAGELTVFAAASLTDAFKTLGAKFTAETGIRVTFAFAGSNTLAKQIENGAPAAVFASADEDWMTYLADKGLIDSTSTISVIGNRLVLIQASDGAGLGGPVTIDRSLDLAKLLGIEKLALGDPKAVPAGKYAKQALTSLGLWDSVSSHVVGAENVRTALLWVSTGEARYGVVYKTDAMAQPRVVTIGTFPENLHKPIRYPFGIVKENDSPQARQFLAYVTSPAAIAYFRQLGFPAAQ